MDAAHKAPPLTPVGQLLKESWAQYRANWKSYAQLIIGTILCAIAPLAIVMLAYVGVSQLSNTMGPNMAFSVLKFLLALLGLIALISTIFFGVLAQGVWYFMIITPNQSLKTLLRQTRPFFWPLLWLGLLTALTFMGLFIPLIIPGFIGLVWMSFVMWTLLLENRRGLAAIVSSREYVRGRFWPVTGRLVLWLVIQLLITVVLSAVGGNDEASAAYVITSILSAIISLFFLSPLGIIYTYRLYQELKQHHGAIVVTEKQRRIYGGLAIWGVIATILFFLLLAVAIWAFLTNYGGYFDFVENKYSSPNTQTLEDLLMQTQLEGREFDPADLDPEVR